MADLAIDLVSWNVHGPPFAARRRARLAAVAGEVEARAPDVALLQEVWFRGDAAWLGARLGGAYALGDGAPRRWPLRAGGLLALVRRDGAWAAEPGLPRFERYGVAAGRWRIWEGDGLAGKGVQVLALRHRPSGAPLAVLHTHVQAQYDTVRHERPRAAQLRHLRDLSATIAPGAPLLAAGDLNTGPAERLYAEHVAPAWIDLTRETRAARPCAVTQFECGAEPQWIDYVLARRNPLWAVASTVDLIENRARDDPFSDHHGLHVRVGFSRT